MGSTFDDVFKLVTNGPNGSFFEYTGATTDVSGNQVTIDFFNSILSSLEKINSTSVEGFGTYNEYRQLLDLADSTGKMKLTLDITTLSTVSDCCNQITESVKKASAKLTYVMDEIQLIKPEDLVEIRNSFNVVSQLLDTVDEFSESVDQQYPIYLEIQMKNQLELNCLSHCMECVFDKVEEVFAHNNKHHSIPNYMLYPPPLQAQVNRFCNYNLALSEFAESLGCNDKDDQTSSSE